MKFPYYPLQVTLQLRNSFQGVQPFGVAVTDNETNSVNRSQESSEESSKLPLVGEETSDTDAGKGR